VGVVPVYMDRAKALSDLNARLRWDSSYKASDHAKGTADGLTWKNRLTALPVGLSTSVAVYNQELLQRKGIAPHKPDWDMDQVVDLSKRLTDPRRRNESHRSPSRASTSAVSWPSSR